MATISDRINTWAKAELRGASQINNDVLLAWWNKGLQIFQKYLLEYVSGTMNVQTAVKDIEADTNEYEFPLGVTNVEDFYSIIQLRVAYKLDKYGQPVYRVCTPINFGDYNIKPDNNVYEDDKLVERGGVQRGKPHIWGRISERNPKYVFVGKNKIKIFPTPRFDVDNGLNLTYNYFMKPLTSFNVNEDTLCLPRYFLDAIEDYLTFRLYQAENPEMAQMHYQTFIDTLHDNIYGLNRDKRPIEEGFANTSYFSHH